jgi:glutamate dehydrogenase/leucine dehydrogenase
MVADVLAERGIAYAPDFVSNGGGAIHLVGYEVLGWPKETVDQQIRGIGDALRVVFQDARRGVSTSKRLGIWPSAESKARTRRSRARRDDRG